MKRTYLRLCFCILFITTMGPKGYGDTAVQVWSSSENLSLRLDQGPDLRFSPAAGRSDSMVRIDEQSTYQSIVGMGSSLEPTTCFNLSRLSEAERRKTIRSLVHPTDGIHMNLMRICIGTPDFTGDPWYSYCDTPDGRPDPELAHFSIAKDRSYILPTLKMALEENPALRFYASPWSPPGWMTSTDDMIGGHLLPAYYDAYARYFVRYIRAYEKAGIPIYAVTIQNEPGVDRSTETDPKWFYPSCTWTGEQERDFIGKHLGPLFAREGIDTEIWSYDHNYNTRPSPDGDDPGISYPRTVLADPVASSYVDKVAFHGYVGSPKGMSTFLSEYPATPVLFTEGSFYGTRGAKKLIDLFRNGASSYNAWVTIIDEHLGPNNGPFECSPTCIMLDSEAGTVSRRFDYYMYGQFMRFVQPGAKRIGCVAGVLSRSTIAFSNPDKSIVIVCVNAKRDSTDRLLAWRDSTLSVTIPGNTITTLRWSTGGE